MTLGKMSVYKMPCHHLRMTMEISWSDPTDLIVKDLRNLPRRQCDQMIWKKNRPIFGKVAKTVAKQNNAKLETIFKQLI